MVDNQHKLIKGYRDLSPEEIALINAIKTMGEGLAALIAELRLAPHYDQRWVSIAQTDFQTGLMAAIRSVAKPESF